jgi:hypothetical protein
VDFVRYTYEKKNFADDVFGDVNYTLGTSPSREPVNFTDIIRIERDKLNQAR